MDVNQLYYSNKVLGISSFVRPEHLRSIYSLDITHYPYTHTCNIQKKTILYFTESLNTEDKIIIQKINQALNQPNYILIEVKELKTKISLFENLLIRFSPQGFVIFGSRLAESLIKTNKTFGKINHQYNNKNIDGCILFEVKAYQGDSPDVQERKKEGWLHLKYLAG